MSHETKLKLPPGVKLLHTLARHRDDTVYSVAFGPQGGRLASGGGSMRVELWETESGKLFRSLDGHQNVIYSVAFDPRGEMIASGSGDQTVRIWKAGSGDLVHAIEGYQLWIYSVTFDPQGKILASGGGDKTVKVWETRSGRLLHTLEGHQHAVLSVAFDPQGEILASGGGDKTIKFWEVRNGKLLRTLEGHQEKVYSVTFDPRGMMLASGSVDKTVKLWEAPSGKLLRTLEGHTASIDIVAFSPDGRLLASKGRDQTIRLWSCETWQTVAIIPEPATPALWIPALAFHPTRSLLATAGSELGKPLSERSGAIHIWELDFDVLSSQRATPTVTYSSVKVVLVGESNVGKSYLAHRIATGASPAQGVIKSTHGMKFWPLEPAPSGSMPTTLIGERVQTSLFTEKLFGTSVVEVNKSQRRDIVLWDMGGQEEYRLIHQLFLHDTTVALVLLDPTRGTTAFKEVETWNKSLERQLRGRTAVKLLVGAKMDQPSGTVDYKALERLREECGFAAYLETSAVTGRGVDELCDAVAAAIDWNNLGKTSRPELFQAIRDELERRRKNGVVVVLLDDFNHELSTDEKAETFSLIEQEVSLASDADAGKRALYAVCEQLAQQGVIALSRTSSGKRAVILRIEEVERYAGSLVLAARNNPREVPALEFRAIASEGFSWPGIDVKERLSREQEKAVIECTVQLMLEHGICFQHEGLMVFPSLFAPTPETADVKLAHAISLYYDFAGAIDNIYASLVAWLVLAKEFGKVRLWSDRAEFEIKDGGLCGLRKVGRAGGFAHVDVYFEKDTPDRQREEFISFVEDHLRQNGVEIREHVAITCPCGHEFTEGTLRQRIARGEKDVGCPVCETRHSMTDGAAAARERDAKIEQHTWALRTQIEKRREELTEQATQTLAKSEKAEPQTGPIRLLHLSDLHFTKDTPVDARLQWLLDDLKLDGGLGIKELDYLAITGDFTDKGGAEGFEKAYEFVSGLTKSFGLSAERCIFVPGNHDVRDLQEAYDWRDSSDGLNDGEWVKQGEIFLARNVGKYPLRFKSFSDSFYHKFLQRPYPMDYAEQGIAIPFWETGLQFLTLNSCWQIDKFNRKRSGINVEAVARAIKQAQKQEDDARKAGQLTGGKPLLRIAMWHHAVIGPEHMENTDFIGSLQKNDVRLALHGDVHEMRREEVGYRHMGKINVVGSGSFGAHGKDRPESTPRLYNVLEIARDLKSVRVYTRHQPKPDGTWDGWHEWPGPKSGKGRVAFYDIKL